MGFNIIDSKIASSLCMPHKHVDSLAQFINISASQPKLIFGDDGTEAELSALGVNFSVDVTDSKVLRTLRRSDILLIKNP